MDQQNYRDRQVRAKSRQVMDYHYDDQTPGKPLHLLIPGGLIALGSLAVIVLIAYQVWWEGSMTQEQGMPLILLLAPFYVGGVFLFSYGYELYDVPRALRLTAIIVFVTLAAVVIVAVLFVVLGGMGKSGSSSKSRSRASSSGKNARAAQDVFSGGGTHGGGIGPIFMGGFPGRTHTETREVIREVPAEGAGARPAEPAKPEPIKCPSCGRSYIPEEHHYLCPGCGAPAPHREDPA